jgi:hypothetical protein
MEFISPEEEKRLRAQRMGRKHPVRAAIEVMEVGQILKVNREEMRWKDMTPSYFCNRIKEKTQKTFDCKKIPGNKGWTVTRVS